MRSKHPTVAAATAPTEARVPEGPQPSPVEISDDQILAAIRRFPAASAAGSGLRPNHLAELVDAPNPDAIRPLLEGLNHLVNLLASGRAPSSVAPWLAGAPLTALGNPDGDVRPIAVRETLRHLVSACLMASASKDARDFFCPLQLGVDTSAGTDAIYRSQRSMIGKQRFSPALALLQVDFSNAFNLVSGSAFLEGVRIHFPGVSAWVEYCYATPAHLSNDSFLLVRILGPQAAGIANSSGHKGLLRGMGADVRPD